MAHNIDMTNNRANMAFLGSRNDIWHSLGQEMPENQDMAAWLKAAGLDWAAVMVPAFTDLSGPEFAHLSDRMPLADNVKHCVRSDNGALLGVASDGYVAHQPLALAEWFEQYVSVDSRFKRDTMMSLKGGKIIAMTAVFNGGISVAGDNHVARLLMTTTFDGTGATINQGTMTRVVCNNTLNVALADKRSVVRTRHNTRFNAERVGAELAQIAASFDQYKAMGDAMAQTHFAKDKVSQFFKACLDIPFDVKSDDISTRKRNQFAELSAAYRATVAEGTEPETAWAALNAVTRYVDHDRSTRSSGNSGETENRFLSAQFGSGATLKSKAVELLYEMSDGDLLKAVAAKSAASMSDADLLKAMSAKVGAIC